MRMSYSSLNIINFHSNIMSANGTELLPLNIRVFPYNKLSKRDCRTGSPFLRRYKLEHSVFRFLSIKLAVVFVLSQVFAEWLISV